MGRLAGMMWGWKLAILAIVLVTIGRFLFLVASPTTWTGTYEYESAKFRQELILVDDGSYQYTATHKGDGRTNQISGNWERSTKPKDPRVFLEDFTLVEGDASFEQFLEGHRISDFSAPAVTQSLFGGPRLVFDPDRPLIFEKVSS
ncbi:hypothetical protein FEE96_14275 [Parasedimentitalea maritima]|uniref:Uncharacterized protein n=1 Tax=Parasedimentitalea maritima TaxID=2578117 RepID=A0ABY2USQ1_9RHOB|nr:hypothetical protein [Zongyanglinia marina]TLP61405.1 hypothetical protein FEE96_14275 [Zongyanglinia marina]